MTSVFVSVIDHLKQCYFSSENHFYFIFYLVQYQLF